GRRRRAASQGCRCRGGEGATAGPRRACVAAGRLRTPSRLPWSTRCRWRRSWSENTSDAFEDVEPAPPVDEVEEPAVVQFHVVAGDARVAPGWVGAEGA